MADLRIVDVPVLLQESITDDVKMPTGGLGNFSVRLGDILWYVVTKEQLANKNYVDTSSKGVKDKLDIHIADKANPHNVTKEQVGLGNVDNTADIDKPVSNAVNSAIITATTDMVTKTYVNQKDNLKADKANTYTKNETDNKISALSATTYAGHKGYATLTDAQAAQSTLAANTLVEVTNDSDSAKNGVYLWDGTTLTKSPYDPVHLLKTYTDEKTKFVKAYRGVNIADLSTAQTGSYIDYTSGNIAEIANYLATDYLEVEGGVEYQADARYGEQFAFYDANKVYISGLASADAEHKFTTPLNAKYIRMSVYNDPFYTDAFMVAKSSEFPEIYAEYEINIQSLKINPSQIHDLADSVESGLGVQRVNIIDTTKAQVGKYVGYLDGGFGNNADFYAAGLYPVKPNTVYQVSSFYTQQFAFYDANKVYISGLISADAEHKFTTPANAAYIAFSIPKEQIDSIVVAEAANFPSGYVPHSAKTIEGLVINNSTNNSKVTEIIVSADTSNTTAAFTGKNAIQLALDSITDASEQNRYRIIAKGVFKVDQAVDYIGYIGYPSMILAKDFVEIIGDGNTVVSAELPYDDADIGLSVNGGNYPRIQYQTLYTYAENALIQGVKFIAKNIRYALHLDNPAGANKRHDFKDVSFIFKGDKGSQQALGVGTSTGEETYFNGGSCHSDVGFPFYCHNNSKFLKPSLMSFKDYSFSSNESKYAILLQNDGSLVKDKIELVGCSFGGSAYIVRYEELWLKKDTSQKNDSFDHAEWTFTGYGNDPFLFENSVGGLSLRFKTTGVGTDKTIRFDKTASAYALLIQNNQANTDVSLYLDNRDYIDGYIVQDGSVGLSAQALGCKDVSGVAGLYDSGVIYTSLGKRLGNCSGVNKVLKVIINGATNTITFNKDYTAMTNSAILTEINAALSGATADLYSYGRDYYPMMSDVAETVYNSGETYIPKGSVVTKSGGTVRPANGNDKVFGVALDDIPVMQTTADGARKGCGRVLKRGYIYANPAKAHYVLADNQAPAIGTKFNVLNGQLVTDSNGKIGVDIDNGIVSINC